MKRILVPVDFSDLSTDLLDVAAKIAKASDGEVYILHVTVPDSFSNDIPPVLPALDNPSVDQRILEGQDLEAMVHYLTEQDIKAKYDLKYGPVVDIIMQEAEKFNADLIVVGSHGGGAIERFLLGSVSQAVALHAKCSVEIVRNRCIV